MYAQSLKTAKGLKVSDAVPAALERAEGWFRYQVVVRAASAKEIVAACRWITRERPAPKDVRISFDMDAQSLA